MTNREKIAENGYKEAEVFENPDYDEAIIGVTINGRVVYDFNKMINHLVEKEGMSEEEAMNYISYNTIRAGEYIDNAPIILEARIEDLT